MGNEDEEQSLEVHVATSSAPSRYAAGPAPRCAESHRDWGAVLILKGPVGPRRRTRLTWASHPSATTARESSAKVNGCPSGLCNTVSPTLRKSTLHRSAFMKTYLGTCFPARRGLKRTFAFMPSQPRTGFTGMLCFQTEGEACTLKGAHLGLRCAKPQGGLDPFTASNVLSAQQPCLPSRPDHQGHAGHSPTEKSALPSALPGGWRLWWAGWGGTQGQGVHSKFCSPAT